MENFKRFDETTEKDDYGCFIGCALTDTLQDIISSLSGGYAILQSYEENSVNPDKQKISMFEKRREEIAALRSYFSASDKTYDDIRRWINLFSKELEEVNTLREPLDKIYMREKLSKLTV